MVSFVIVNESGSSSSEDGESTASRKISKVQVFKGSLILCLFYYYLLWY